MKKTGKLLLGGLIALLMAVAIPLTALASEWQQVGQGVPGSQVNSLSLRIAGDGTLYMAYVDEYNGNMVTVNKYNGTNWETVGGLTSGSFPSLYVNNGNLYVAFADGTNGNKVTVKRYNGGAWETVGSAGFSDGSASSVSLFVYNEDPYVAYPQYYNSQWQALVSKYNGVWETVGSAGFFNGPAGNVSLYIKDDGTPYVAFKDSGSWPETVSVAVYNSGSWDDITGGGFSGQYTSLYIAGDTPYLAYNDGLNSYKATVKKYNGSAWETVGSAGFSDGQAIDLSLFVYNGEPYVAYADSYNGYKATVKKYNGSAWETVGSASFSDGQAGFTSLCVYNGTIYAAYRDNAHSNEAIVMSFEPQDSSDFAGGTGSPEDPYLIATKEHLNNLRNHLDAHYKLTANIVFDESDFQEGGAFDNDGKGWEPIGTLDQLFNGNFDGDGYTITRLYIDRSDEYGIGFFGYTGEGAVIENVGLEDVDIGGNYRVGGLVGWNKGKISNVYVVGEVKGKGCLGGLVGQNGSNSGSAAVISNSYTSGDVLANDQDWGIGGLVGENSETGKISSSYSVVTVDGGSEGESLGGLAGDNRGEITNSFAAGTVTGQSEYVGGLIGTQGPAGTIADAYAVGQVTGDDYVGGFIASNWGGSIQNVYAAGVVTSNGSNVGGLAVENDGGTITNSYYNSDTTGQNDTGKGEGKTIVEMKQQDTFFGWDFTADSEVWNIIENETYPYLRWQDENQDLAPPVFIDSYPKAGIITNQSVELQLKQDEAGIVYYVVLSPAHAKPMAAQIKEGKNAGGWVIEEDNLKGNMVLGSATEATLSIIDLEYWTDYSIYLVAEDAEGNLQTDGMVTKVDVTTADEYQIIMDGHTYTYTDNGDGTATISEFDRGVSTDIEIPDMVDGLTVTHIGNEAFYDKGLTDVTLPSTVTNIGDRAFMLNPITEIEIPQSVISIGDYAFSMMGAPFQPTVLASVTFAPNSALETIGEFAFYNNQMESLELPDSVINIGVSTFINNKLESLILGSNIEGIGDYAFGDNLLSNLTIPDSVISIGEGAFLSNQIEEVLLGNGIVSIGSGAFYNNELTTVEIPGSVMSIGTDAFANNQSVASNLIIVGNSGSAAKIYAEENGHTFESLDAPTYTIVYNGNGNTGGSVPTDSHSYEEGETVTVVGNTDNLTRTGYTFAGWNTSADGSGTGYAAGQSFTIGSSDVTLYALWTPVSGGSSGDSSGGSRQTSPPPSSNTVPVTVDGKAEQQAAAASTKTQGDKTITTVTLDTRKITKTVNAAQTGSKVTIPITGKADVAVGELNGQLVKTMETKQAVIEIKTDAASYTLPAKEINIDDVSARTKCKLNRHQG